VGAECTPNAIVAKLNAAALVRFTDPAVRKHWNLGLQMPPKDQLSPASLGALAESRDCEVGPVIKAANVKVGVFWQAALQDLRKERQPPRRHETRALVWLLVRRSALPSVGERVCP